MKVPRYLKPGDSVALVAPARFVDGSVIEYAEKILKSWGFEVKTASNLVTKHNQFAGTDSVRASEFQTFLDDETVRAIICVRGGYGTVRIMDKLNFDRFKKSPKWIAGFSDITVLHSFVNHVLQIETLHCQMPVNFKNNQKDNNSLEYMRAALTGRKLQYRLKSNSLDRPGIAEGIITGGNLSVLYSLRGTDFDVDTTDKILFLEDTGEYIYHIDRMMQNLRTGNLLKSLNGLIVGGMTEMNDNEIPFGKSPNEIIAEAIESYGFPVLFDFPAGHGEHNYPLIMGRKVFFDVNSKESILNFNQ